MITPIRVPGPSSRPERGALKIAFVLTMQGSLHRFTLLRRFVEREDGVDARWLAVHMWRPDDPLRVLPSALRAHVRSLLEVRAIFGDRSLDAVFFHAYTPHVIYTWFTWLLRRRTVSVWCRDNPPLLSREIAAAWGVSTPTGPARWLKRWLWRATFARTDLIVARCAFTKRLLASECGVPEERIHVLHYGVDLDAWPAHARPVRAPDRRVQLLFVGGDFVRKGGDVLLRVFAQQLAETCELHLVTSRAQIRAALGPEADRELGPHVHVYEGVAAESAMLRHLYARADISVLPSRIDLAPFAILEAMAMGLPVVSTAVGGIPELVEEGVTGYTVAPGDEDALRAALAHLIADPFLCQRMGLAARRRVEESYDARRNVPLLLDMVCCAAARTAPYRDWQATSDNGWQATPYCEWQATPYHDREATGPLPEDDDEDIADAS